MAVTNAGVGPFKPYPTLLIIGHAGHGKDEVAAILAKHYDIEHRSSSLFICEKAVLPHFPAGKYASVHECYADRGRHRKFWKDKIREYNTPDLARLATELMQEADIYVGIRDKDEFFACMDKNLFDLVIWVDALNRCPPESKDSNQMIPAYADIILDNNCSKEELVGRVIRLGRVIYGGR